MPNFPHSGVYGLLSSNGSMVEVKIFKMNNVLTVFLSMLCLQAYCAMELIQEGGPWLLVGKINQPTFWNVRSTTRTITPNGMEGISQLFGNLPVTELRIQFSTSPCLDHAIKADWYAYM